MAIKPDHWIRRMSLEHGMIDPFVEKQVREGGISYGVSSYGYDIRLGYEFKVFTNVNNTVVDPKHFDESSFVHFEGETCTIPPNSFVLSRTIEHFKIPRNVLAICVGKSTYARCFSGDTHVALVDGSAPTLEDMAARADQGELFWGYSMGPNGRIIVALLDVPRFIGRDRLLEITLDNNEVIRCTPDHEFILRDGRSLPASDLRIGTSLMPLYRQLARGYEMTYQPINGQLVPTHRLADEWNVRNRIYTDLPNTHRHHKDHNRRNNMPWNIARVPGKHTQTGLIAAITQSNAIRQAYNNHKITSIRTLAGDHDVYCLSVPEAGNFALEAGVFVHNCGLIVNVTPLEPQWEGYLTLEISNTTPLPARIYGGEGIAQLLFLESDEMCETSYADRKGKYQHQVEVTLPRL
jgi:dCTP deaminase